MRVGEVLGVDVTEPGPPGGACAVHQSPQGCLGVVAARELGRHSAPTLAARVRRRRERLAVDVRSRPTTVPPACSTAVFTAAPIPEAAPVTTTVCPVRSVIGGWPWPRRGRVDVPAEVRAQARRSDRVGQGAQTVDGQGDHVPGLERGRVLGAATAPQLGQASAVPDGPGPQDVAGLDRAVPGRVGDQGLEGPPHVGEQVASDLVAVHGDRAPEVEEAVGVAVRLQLVGGDDPRPEGGAEVLALGRPEADLHLASLDVASRPVVHDRVAEDMPCGFVDAQGAAGLADHDRDLELEISRLAGAGKADLVVWAEDGVRVGEVERRCVVPGVGHSGCALDGLAHTLRRVPRRSRSRARTLA